MKRSETAADEYIDTIFFHQLMNLILRAVKIQKIKSIRINIITEKH